jgi:DNA end-binding protein Ku
VLRTHEYLCAVRCSGDALLLTTLLYADELVSPKDIALPDEKPKPTEVKTAAQLIESLTGPLDHDAFRDEQREGQIDLLDRLAHGEKFRKPEKREEKPAQSAEDLMAALEKSLERARERASERMAEDGGAKKNGGSKKASPRKKRS